MYLRVFCEGETDMVCSCMHLDYSMSMTKTSAMAADHRQKQKTLEARGKE